MEAGVGCLVELVVIFFMQLNEKNQDMEIMVDFDTRETVTLKELLPLWWGEERYQNGNQ